jgi:hypothetical protein
VDIARRGTRLFFVLVSFFFFFFLFFLSFFFFFSSGAAEGQSLEINFPGPSPFPQALKAGAQQRAKGKRDKYRYEVECVTDVWIGYILNR